MSHRGFCVKKKFDSINGVKELYVNHESLVESLEVSLRLGYSAIFN